MTLFDSYLIVDWSAANRRRRGKDSIWLATYELGGKHREPATCNAPTRFEALACVTGWLRRRVEAKRRVLVGFDFVYGFPSGFSHAMALDGTSKPWRRVWEEVECHVKDDRHNRNDRFEVAAKFNARIGDPSAPGPFWGCPPQKACRTLKPSSCIFPYPAGGFELMKFRRTECRLRENGYSPLSAWQLAYVGAVGSQALTGLPHLMRLRYAMGLAEVSAVWPFETGFNSTPCGDRRPFILHAEVWPSLLPWDGIGIKDQSQVRNLVQRFVQLDQRGRLGALFERPTGLNDVETEQCCEEEGWILGACTAISG